MVELVAEESAAPIGRKWDRVQPEPSRERADRIDALVGPRIEVARDDHGPLMSRENVAYRLELRTIGAERQREVDRVHVHDRKRLRAPLEWKPRDDRRL